MFNSRSRARQQPLFDLSKFWAFRLINILFVISIFLIISFLVIPIPYFNKQRSPTVIDLDFNHSSYSHAIRLTTSKLPDNVLSVSFSTHNSDHIIGSTTFGDVTLERDSNSIARFVNGHYHERRKGLPFRVLVVDVHKRAFVFRRYIATQSDDSSYRQIEGWTYVMMTDPMEEKSISLSALMTSKPSYVYKTQYEDRNGKIVTHYITDAYNIFGTITAGSKTLQLDPYPAYRTITTVYHNPSNINKIIIASVNRESLQPKFKELYQFGNDEVYYESFNELIKGRKLNVTDATFDINRYEGDKLDPIQFKHDQHKSDGLVIFEYKHEGYRYEIVLGDHRDDYVNPNLGSPLEKVLEIKPNTYDRMVLLSYSPKEPIPPNYYIFDRMGFHTKYRLYHYVD